MKLAGWILLAVGVLLFFNAPDQLIGWLAVMTAVTGASIIVYKWGRDTGYMSQR